MFNFRRRINGLTYYAGLACFYALVALGAILIELPPADTALSAIVGLGVVIEALALLFYIVCITRQRANDIGWHPLLVTCIGFWTPLVFILGLFPGQKTTNEYGPVPSRGVSLRQ